MRLLVTGGMGFIGSRFLHYWLEKHPQDAVVNFDLLTYAGNSHNVADIRNVPGYLEIRGSITDAALIERVMTEERIDTVVHFAAESHVDRSILDPHRFIQTNVLGTQTLLEAAKKHKVSKFVHISTDEVYGTLGEQGSFNEQTPLAPNSPYSASKAGSDLFVRSYYETYGLPAVITRCSNNYGPYQFPEKLIPTIITRALQDEAVPIYGDGLQIRDWLFVDDHCTAIDLVIHKGRSGEVYNIGGSSERTNLYMVKRILQELGKSEQLIRFVPDRLGHDRRYAVDSSKIRNELGWRPTHTLDEGLLMTLDWYRRNESWWRAILDGTYQLEECAHAKEGDGL
ncbi:dTDP-glucose 4,6-dehydratase [Paenibacillus sp. 1_12]|uniref:dTDP-glucose 4,6-dehydratase n=1 Tax=Paenibacillus sp. 1_12 TaxID=1566278 RepID=UPI0008E200FE|nr:dTDP-glucose 4,6-dehydratase [Paenibacillus sp. 1_12]SFK72270.1 dTDP-glucose 4,6-dehydratase [Paenibacillus sp. 1_12]